MSLVACRSIHEGHEWFSDDSRGKQGILMCLASLLYVSNLICRFANGGAQARFRRRTSHEPNRMLMRENKGFFSFAFDSAHVKYDV